MADNSLKVNTFHTMRLLLTEYTPQVQQHLFTNATDSEIIAFLGLPDAQALQQEKEKFAKGYTTFRTSFKNFVLVEKETGTVIGHCGFHTWYILHDRAEIGYALTDENAKRKGYMKEAMAFVIAHGFNEMGLNRIEAFLSPANIPSVKLVEHFGFEREGLLRGHYCKNGIVEDSAVYGLLRKDYLA